SREDRHAVRLAGRRDRAPARDDAPQRRLMITAALEDVWRDCAPGVLGALVRRYGDFDAAEDAAQEALVAASRQWPADGLPENPKGWLITVASRRLVDGWRAEQARSERERLVARRDRHEAFL